MVNGFNIRPANVKDWADIIEIYNYYIKNTVFNFEYDAHTLQSRLPWFMQFQNQSKYKLLVVCDNTYKVVGYAATTPFNLVAGYHTSANINIYCHPEYTGKQLGSKLLKELIQQSKDDKIHKLYAGITINNEASICLFKKYGFIQTACFKEVGYKFDQFWDVAWLELNMTVGGEKINDLKS